MKQQLLPEQWVSVRRLAEAIGESPGRIYGALYAAEQPMPCARDGRAIRVRLVDWLAFWDARRQAVIKREPPRSRFAGAAR